MSLTSANPFIRLNFNDPALFAIVQNSPLKKLIQSDADAGQVLSQHSRDFEDAYLDVLIQGVLFYQALQIPPSVFDPIHTKHPNLNTLAIERLEKAPKSQMWTSPQMQQYVRTSCMLVLSRPTAQRLLEQELAHLHSHVEHSTLDEQTPLASAHTKRDKSLGAASKIPPQKSKTL